MGLINHTYKLLVIDIDGTLIGEDGTIPAENRDALARVRRSGIRVSLSTGRVVKTCVEIIDQLSLEGNHIFFDGALVSNPEKGEEICVKPISEELVRQAVEFARLNEINLDLFSATQYFIERETWASEIRRRFFGIPPTIVDFTKLGQRERIIKGTLAVNSTEEKAKADDFSLHFKESLRFSLAKTPAYPDIDFINIVDPGVSKGKALEVLASYLGIPMSEVIAVGDGANDISLLSTAGLAVAMGNATDEVKAVADYITLDVEHSGLAAAIERFLL